MKQVFVLLFLFPLSVFSQKFSVDRPDETIKPDPYTKTYFTDKNDYSKVESVTTIVKDRHRDFNPDTLMIDYYDKKGLKIKSIRFSNNKRSTTTLFKYDLKNDLSNWHTFEKGSSTLTTYKYNKPGQLAETHQYRLTVKDQRTDSTETSRMLFRYDDQKLVQINNNALGVDVIEKYRYIQNRLDTKTGGYVSKKMRYNNSGQVTQIEEYMGGSIDSIKIMGLQKYAYDKQGRVKTDSMLTSMNFKTNTYQVTAYGYNNKGILDTMSSRFGNFYRNVKFKYANGKIDEIYLETNGNSAYLRFIISHRIDEYYSFPIRYREKFSYDKYGNKISRKVYVNEELFSEVEYVIVYK